uniref:CUB domain-containing protein n=1 Tax=Cyprinus carpio TaxID=7962 RepID=A0A8C1LXQ4_CYPCA
NIVKRGIICLLLLWICVKVCECELAMFGDVSSTQLPDPANVHYLDIEPSPNCCHDSLILISDKKVMWKFCGQNSTDIFHTGHKPIVVSGNCKLFFLIYKSNPKSLTGFTASYQATGEHLVPEWISVFE